MKVNLVAQEMHEELGKPKQIYADLIGALSDEAISPSPYNTSVRIILCKWQSMDHLFKHHMA